MPNRNRLYDGNNWSDSSADDDDDPVWGTMWPQLPPWIHNPENWEEEPEAVCNPNWVPVVDLTTITKALEEDDQVKNKTNNTGRNEIPSGEHLEYAKISRKTWDNVGSHSSTLRNKSELKSSDAHTTTSRQGEE